MNPTSYTVQDLAEMLGCCTRTIYNYVREGKIRKIRVKRNIIFLEEHVQEFLKEYET